jgi:hypothetical protein
LFDFLRRIHRGANSFKQFITAQVGERQRLVEVMPDDQRGRPSAAITGCAAFTSTNAGHCGRENTSTARIGLPLAFANASRYAGKGGFHGQGHRLRADRRERRRAVCTVLRHAEPRASAHAVLSSLSAEQDQQARAAAHEEERGFALKSLAQMESSSHIAQAAASASRDAATAAHTSALIARRSAFWTMIAAIASATGVVVNAALNLGWLEWARHVAR